MDAMFAHIRENTDPNAPGFRKSGEKQDVKYEIHDAKTAAQNGAGYFRLHVRISRLLWLHVLLEANLLV